jgi:hypothetical protein
MPLLTELENVLGCDSTKMSPLTGLVRAGSFSVRVMAAECHSQKPFATFFST